MEPYKLTRASSGDDPSACCSGATCRSNSGGNWMQCLADNDDPVISNPTTPTTTAPVNSPVPVPTQPPANPTAPPVTSPTATPTNPTATQGCCSQKYLSFDVNWCG
eukprot:scaffold408608_cov47-Attheya_sp.AAC.2